VSDTTARHYASPRATTPDPASTRPLRRPDPAVVHLRVVRPPGLSPARRRRRVRLVGTLVSFFVVAVVFGLVGLHVMLAQNQFRLDRLNTQAAAEQAAYERSRLKVDQLSAPDRIVGEAESKLGMVPAGPVTNLAPSPPATAASSASAGSGRKSPTTNAATTPQGDHAPTDWSTVKPQLVPSQ